MKPGQCGQHISCRCHEILIGSQHWRVVCFYSDKITFKPKIVLAAVVAVLR